MQVITRAWRTGPRGEGRWCCGALVSLLLLDVAIAHPTGFQDIQIGRSSSEDSRPLHRIWHRSSSAQSRSRVFLLPFLCAEARGGDSSVTGRRETSLPAVEGRMSSLHGYEGSLHTGCHFAFDIDEPLDGHAITLCGGRACPNMHGLRDGGRAKKLHFVRRGYGSGWRIHSTLPHESISGGPVSVAVEEGR